MPAKLRTPWRSVRTLAPNLRENVVVQAGEPGKFVGQDWEMETLAEMEAVGNADFSDGYIPARAYKKTDDRRTDYINFVGAAGGWGGAMIREDISQDGQPNIIPTRESNTTNRFNVLMRH